MVEIAKAVSYEFRRPDHGRADLGADRDARSAISSRSSATCAPQGNGIVYITHKMNELFEIADEFSVFRDGKYIGTHASTDVTRDDIIRMMVGREITQMFPEGRRCRSATSCSRCKDLTPRRRLPRRLLRRARRRDPRRRRPRRLGPLQCRRDALRRDARRPPARSRIGGKPVDDRLADDRDAPRHGLPHRGPQGDRLLPDPRRPREHADGGAAATASSRAASSHQGAVDAALRGDERRRCASRRPTCTSASRTSRAATSRRC